MDPRYRLTTGVNRRRLQLEARRAAKPSVVLIFGVVLAIVILAYFLIHISPTIGRTTYEIRVAVPTAFGVFEGFDDVRFRGVPAGTISAIERDGARIILRAEIRKEYGPVYRDARLELRPITPLNDVYLDIVDPGTPSSGRATTSTVLPERQTTTSVTVPDVLDSLTADARRNAYRLLDQLGNGMDDGGVKLQQAFVQLAPFLRQAGVLSRSIAQRAQQTKTLVHNTSLLTATLADRDAELRRLVASGAVTFAGLQQSSPDLDATLRELGPTFTQLRSSLGAVRGVVDNVDAGLRSVYPVADALPGGLTALRRLADDLDPAVAALQRPIRDLAGNGWLDGVHDLGLQLRPAAAGLRGQIPTYDHLTEQLVNCEKGVIGFFQWNNSMAKFGDQNGPVPRGNLAFGLPSPGFNTPARQPEAGCTPGLPPSGAVKPEDLH
jgi:virulence factor Mce-like protein